MKERTASNYLKDLGSLVKEKALEAKEIAQISVDPFDKGVLMAFHDIVSLMQSQAVVFGLSLEEIELSDINPDADLL